MESRPLVKTIMMPLLSMLVILIAVAILSDVGILRMAGPAFDLGAESSIPTWFATTTLLILAIVTSIIAIDETRESTHHARHWRWLSIAFLAFSVEEIAAFREFYISQQLRLLLNADGIFYYAWVIPAIAIILIFVVTYFRFWLHLQKEIRTLFLIAVVLYIGGGLGFEFVEGYINSNIDPSLMRTYLDSIRSISEESLELIGVHLMLYTVLLYATTRPQLNKGMTRLQQSFENAQILHKARFDIVIVLVGSSIGLGFLTNVFFEPEYEGLASTLISVGLPVRSPPLKEPIEFGEDVLFWGSRYEYNPNLNLIDVRLWWWFEEPADYDYSVAVYLLDESGSIVVQTDGTIQDIYFGEVGMSAVDPNHIYLDERVLQLEDDTLSNRYIVAMSVYQWWDNVRLTTSDGNDLLILGEIYIDR